MDGPQTPAAAVCRIRTDPSSSPCPQEIASILLSRGALSFPQLIKLTSLPPALVHSSLLVLSTHTLLFHSETEVGGRLTELYELNHDAIERRIRGGLYVEMASEWEGGEELSTVIEVLWKEGMLTREDLYEVVRQKILHKQEMELGVGQEDPKGKKRARMEDQGAFSFSPFSAVMLTQTPLQPWKLLSD